jgi:medium-chain acyl-[acyl-carrier-protein] hydrolase
MHRMIATTPAGPADAGWVVRWQPSPRARLRMFCLPHAGAGASVYRHWGRHLGPDIDVVAVRPPARERRHAETPITDLATLVQTVVTELRPMFDLPQVWFGHSLGAIVAFEACRTLRATGIAEPARLIVTGRQAPRHPSRVPPVHAAGRSQIVDRLRLLGGTPQEVLDEPALLARALPMLRADFGLSETYRYVSGPPLDCPITVFGGAHDPLVPPPDLEGWAGHTTAGCSVRVVPGGHFFLHDDPAAVLDAIAEELLRPGSHGPPRE